MVEFIKETHQYINEFGIIVPSVTQLINWKLGDGYGDVPEAILKAKAEYGTKLHTLIEKYCKEGSYETSNPYHYASMEAYKILEKKLPRVVANEQMVDFDNRLAGTIDIVYEDDSLGDIKTYATLDEHALLRVKWQLSLYMLCKYGKKMDKIAQKVKTNHMLHFPKNMSYGKYNIGIFTSDECINLLEEYEAQK